MEDYPRTLAELEARFATDVACRKYLAQLRWPDGFACPRCSGAEAWATARGLLVCAACGYHASVTAGTLFQDTHKPLTTWFRMIWLVTSQKTGASALNLQRVLGLGSYRTAWSWLHKLRRAMVRPGRERLSGRVELDESYVGGVEEASSGVASSGDTILISVAELDGAVGAAYAMVVDRYDVPGTPGTPSKLVSQMPSNR